jgi:hypothetical protein
MSRPDPIQYAERLYAAIRAANFSPISFLAFGNAVKEGVELRRMPRIAAEPFMRVVGEMLDLEDEARKDDLIEGDVIAVESPSPNTTPETTSSGAADPPADPIE